MEAKDWVHEKRQESGKSQGIVLGWGSQADDKRTGERMCPSPLTQQADGRVLAHELVLRGGGEAE